MLCHLREPLLLLQQADQRDGRYRGETCRCKGVCGCVREGPGFPLRVNPVKKIPISKSPSKLATPGRSPSYYTVSWTGFASFDRVFSSGKL